MIITLVRHGEVEEKYHRCYNGHNNISLSLKGREEALELAQHLKEKSFDAIYSSDLKRCQETVTPIINQLKTTVIPVKTGIHEQQLSNNPNSLIPASAGMTETSTLLTEELSKNSKEYFEECQETVTPTINLLAPEISTTVIPIVFTKDLREKSWGRHEGMTFDAIVSREGLIYEDFEQWIHALDGEPYQAYIQRIRDFFTLTLPQTDYNNVLVVTHAGVIRVLMHLLQNISLQEAFSIDFPYSAYTTLDTKTWTFGETLCVS